MYRGPRIAGFVTTPELLGLQKDSGLGFPRGHDDGGPAGRSLLSDSLKQAASGSLETTHRGSFPAADTRPPNRKRCADPDRRFDTVESAPAFLQGFAVETAKTGEFVRQAFRPGFVRLSR